MSCLTFLVWCLRIWWAVSLLFTLRPGRWSVPWARLPCRWVKPSIVASWCSPPWWRSSWPNSMSLPVRRWKLTGCRWTRRHLVVCWMSLSSPPCGQTLLWCRRLSMTWPTGTCVSLSSTCSRSWRPRPVPPLRRSRPGLMVMRSSRISMRRPLRSRLISASCPATW